MRTTCFDINIHAEETLRVLKITSGGRFRKSSVTVEYGESGPVILREGDSLTMNMDLNRNLGVTP